MSYFNAPLNIPKGNDITLNANNSNSVIITSNDNTLSNFTLVLPNKLGTSGQILNLSSVSGNVGYLEFSDSLTGLSGLSGLTSGTGSTGPTGYTGPTGTVSINVPINNILISSGTGLSPTGTDRLKYIQHPIISTNELIQGGTALSYLNTLNNPVAMAIAFDDYTHAPAHVVIGQNTTNDGRTNLTVSNDIASWNVNGYINYSSSMFINGSNIQQGTLDNYTNLNNVAVISSTSSDLILQSKNAGVGITFSGGTHAHYFNSNGALILNSTVPGTISSGTAGNTGYALFSQGPNQPLTWIDMATFTGTVGDTGDTGATGYTGSTGATGPVSSVIQQTTLEPMGFPARTDSTIAFDYTSQTFSIQPASTSYDIWVSGTQYTKTASSTVPVSTNGLNYIYYGSGGTLGIQTSVFVWDQQAPTAYIYYNSSYPSEYMLFDERHGVTMDWATHEYLHRTRGAAIANGFDLADYTLTGLGTSNADVQFSISTGTFFDEDLQVDITDGAPGIWSMKISFPATLPTLYLDGTVWRKPVVSEFCMINAPGGRPYYNSVTGGSGSLVETANNKYLIQWIVATNMAYTPIISVMGQDDYNTVIEAQNISWSDMTLTGFPIVELRPLYKLIFETKNTFTNYVKARLDYAQDIRLVQSTIIPAPTIQAYTGSTGYTGPTGPTGYTGPQGINGVTSGLVLFLDGVTTTTIPAADTLLLIPDSGSATNISHSANGVNDVLIGTFTTPQNSLTSTVVVPGLWTSYLYASATTLNAISYYFTVDEVDSAGTSVLQNIINGIGNTTAIGTSIDICVSQIYGTAKTLASLSSRLRLSIYANYTGGPSKTLAIYMRNGNASNLVTTLVANLGPTGSTGMTGPTGSAATSGLLKYIYQVAENYPSGTGATNPALLDIFGNTTISGFSSSTTTRIVRVSFGFYSDSTGTNTIGLYVNNSLQGSTINYVFSSTSFYQTTSCIFKYTSSNTSESITIKCLPAGTLTYNTVTFRNMEISEVQP